MIKTLMLSVLAVFTLPTLGFTNDSDDDKDGAIQFLKSRGARIISYRFSGQVDRNKCVIVLDRDWTGDYRALQSLDRIKTLAGVIVNDVALSPEEWACLLDRPNLSAILLYNVRLPKEALSILSKLQSLEVLALREMNVQEDAILALESLPKLKYVALSNTGISSDALLGLKGSKNTISSLEINGIECREGYFKTLCEFPKLEELHMRQAKIKSDTIDWERLVSLRILDLAGTSLDDSGLRQIARLPKLEGLSVASTKITDAGFEGGFVSPNLTRLGCENTSIGDSAVEHLKEVQSLESLYICNTNVTDESLPAIASLDKMRSLKIRNNRVTSSLWRDRLPQCKVVTEDEPLIIEIPLR